MDKSKKKEIDYIISKNVVTGEEKIITDKSYINYIMKKIEELDEEEKYYVAIAENSNNMHNNIKIINEGLEKLNIYEKNDKKKEME